MSLDMGVNPGLPSLGQLVVPPRSVVLESDARHGPSQGSGCQQQPGGGGRAAWKGWQWQLQLYGGTMELQLVLKWSCCPSHAESQGQKFAHGRWHWSLVLGWSGYPAAHGEVWFVHRGDTETKMRCLEKLHVLLH